ncbi:MAG TPA: DUF3179 domain-containing (seleno)protein [Phnomibacter sp.]|nr:DUF3179 domain-containing (seleno)protein [Phnomibacter sp.]
MVGIIPVIGLLIFSLLNANPKVYIALSENQVIKSKHVIYPPVTEVLGYVDANGNAIVYPLNEMIKPRHILNDTFLGKPILISYCMACRSAVVYNPVVQSQRLHFDVLGVYRRNMVMMDRLTGTVWQQGTGEAMCGLLKGTQLEILAYQQTTLANWLEQYPNSWVAQESATVKDGIFSKDRLLKMMQITEWLVAPGKTNLDGLPLRAPVFGVEINGHAKAYPVAELKKQSTFNDVLGGIEVTVNYNPVSNFITIIATHTNQPIAAQSHWWFGWKEFHPNTGIWRAV